jgi:hypothetical protein
MDGRLIRTVVWLCRWTTHVTQAPRRRLPSFVSVLSLRTARAPKLDCRRQQRADGGGTWSQQEVVGLLCCRCVRSGPCRWGRARHSRATPSFAVWDLAGWVRSIWLSTRICRAVGGAAATPIGLTHCAAVPGNATDGVISLLNLVGLVRATRVSHLHRFKKLRCKPIRHSVRLGGTAESSRRDRSGARDRGWCALKLVFWTDRTMHVPLTACCTMYFVYR